MQLLRRFPWRPTCFIVYDERCATVFPVGKKVDFPLHERSVDSTTHAHKEGNFRAKAGKCHDACRNIAFKPSRKRFGEANALQVGQPAMASKRVDMRFVGADEGSTLVMGAPPAGRWRAVPKSVALSASLESEARIAVHAVSSASEKPGSSTNCTFDNA